VNLVDLERDAIDLVGKCRDAARMRGYTVPNDEIVDILHGLIVHLRTHGDDAEQALRARLQMALDARHSLEGEVSAAVQRHASAAAMASRLSLELDAIGRLVGGVRDGESYQSAVGRLVEERSHMRDQLAELARKTCPPALCSACQLAAPSGLCVGCAASLAAVTA